MTLLQGLWNRLTFTLTALLVSSFPEEAKRSGWPSAYASVAAHVFAGWVETIASAGLFGIGFLRYVNGFIQGPGWLYLSNRPGNLDTGDFFGMGVLGYVSYLVTPVAWVTLFCVAEGIVRALDAAFSERMLGMAFVVLPWRAVLAARRTGKRRRLEAMLGPERPDEVVTGQAGSPVALTVFAARRKPWSDYQVIDFAGEFYEATGVRIVGRGLHHAYRYDFRRLEPGDVIRGVLVRYDPRSGSPPPQSTGERPGAPARQGLR